MPTMSSPHNSSELLEACQEALHYQFSDVELLRSALTHASGANSRLASNERLEFLGDAILGLVVCERLFERFGNLLEGEMTRIKSIVVSRRTCAVVSRSLGLDRYLLIGKGMQAEVPANVLADVFESLIAAIYLDGGLEAARSFVLGHLGPEIDAAAADAHGENYKSALQHWSQREAGTAPHYQLLDEKGPEHSKCFKVAAVVGVTHYPPAWGKSKKEAEQKAALNALSQIRSEPIPFLAD
jgi:ribonuclease-3